MRFVPNNRSRLNAHCMPACPIQSSGRRPLRQSIPSRCHTQRKSSHEEKTMRKDLHQRAVSTLAQTNARDSERILRDNLVRPPIASTRRRSACARRRILPAAASTESPRFGPHEAAADGAARSCAHPRCCTHAGGPSQGMQTLVARGVASSAGRRRATDGWPNSEDETIACCNECLDSGRGKCLPLLQPQPKPHPVTPPGPPFALRAVCMPSDGRAVKFGAGGWARYLRQRGVSGELGSADPRERRSM